MAISTSIDTTNLTATEIEFLEQHNICQRCIRPGKRTVSGTFLSPPSRNPSSSSSSSSSSSFSASVRTRNFNSDSLKSFEVPVTTESADVLEFIGFLPQTANEIFQRYQSRPSPDICPDDLMDYVYGHISMLNLACLRESPPRQACSRLGLTSVFQDALMDPNFTPLFWTESLLFWIRDTLYTNYVALLHIQQRLKNQAQRRGIVPAVAIRSTQPDEQPSQILSAFHMTPEDYNLPANHIALEHEGPILPDHLVLYKGKATREMPWVPWIYGDGSPNMKATRTSPQGDFNYNKSVSYWTQEKAVAEEYRKWAARRCPYSETWLIRIQIPISFINTLKRAELWYGADWKEYVWHCKSGQSPPAKFEHLYKDGQADIVQGHISTGVAMRIAQIEKEDVQRTITEDHTLKVPDTTPSRMATQHAFMQDSNIQRLAEVIRGKIHIELTGPSKLQENSSNS